MQKASLPLGRGVYVAPWMGPNGEIVLFAITAARTLCGEPVTIPHGASRIAVADGLWQRLDELDPEERPLLRAI